MIKNETDKTSYHIKSQHPKIVFLPFCKLPGNMDSEIAVYQLSAQCWFVLRLV